MSNKKQKVEIEIKTFSDYKEMHKQLKDYREKLSALEKYKEEAASAYKDTIIAHMDELKKKINDIQMIQQDAPIPVKAVELQDYDQQIKAQQAKLQEFAKEEAKIKEDSLERKKALLEQYNKEKDEGKAGEILKQIQFEDAKTAIELEAVQARQAVVKKEVDENVTKLNEDRDKILSKEKIEDAETLEEKYRLQRDAFKVQLLAYKDNDKKIREIKKEQEKADKEHYDKLTKNMTAYATKIKETYTSISDAILAVNQWEIAEEQDNHERKLANMKAEGKTDEDIQKESDKLKAEREAKDLKRRRAKADRDKYFAVFDTILNTSTAIVKMLSDPGGFAGVAMSIAAGITGAAQITKIIATPLPKKARGGLIGGKPHSLGGTLIEAEAGEAVINKRSTSMFAPLLSAINESGGGVPFAAPLSDGGFAQREYQRRNRAGLNEAQMEQAMARAFSQQQIYVAIEDINKGQKQYAQVTDTSKF